MNAASVFFLKASITHAVILRQLVSVLLILGLMFLSPARASGSATDAELKQFNIAWEAAKRGDHASFRQDINGLQDYILFPYLQYEDYRNRRGSVPVDQMADFLASHEGWAFTAGLRNAWLKTLAGKKRWAELVAYSDGVRDTVIQCQRIRGRIILKQTDGVMADAQKLWAVGKSQPDECDPVFAWLIKNDGISETLAWERIRLAIEAGNRSLVSYLARFVPADQSRWLDDWQQFSFAGYSRLERARNWPDNPVTRMIASASLQHLARNDAELAAKTFDILDSHFKWEEVQRMTLLRDIALFSAVAMDKETTTSMLRVPFIYRDAQLLEWWARFLLSGQDWAELEKVIEQMPEDTRNDDRWLYWLAQAGLRSGRVKPPSPLLQELSGKANYYGFLAADELGSPYNICPRQAEVDEDELERVAGLDGFRRALELRKAGLDSWAVSEWVLAAGRLPVSDLKAAAALAVREDWYDRAIFALGNSGDLNLYEWRFPLLWETDISKAAKQNQLDPAWVYGTIRSESAMVETARSPANALGLMQITPATGKRLAKKHGLPWNGVGQLKTVNGNLPIGAAYMSDLLRDFAQNPVLVSGAYNAGPNVVQRWLNSRPRGEAAIWIETLPYFETRDYIPRVLAFTTIYDWRLGGTVKRISDRMPNIESGKIAISGHTEVVCRD
ncbi:MAG: transglycosylase SLT domain-containing protein [Lysobacterales bacterium]